MKLWKVILFSLIPCFVLFFSGEMIVRTLVRNDLFHQWNASYFFRNDIVRKSAHALNINEFRYDPYTGYRIINDSNPNSYRPPLLPAAPKKANEIRILCLGDSVTHGHTLTEEFAWPGRLQEHINSWSSEDQDIVVFNGAVPGYSAVMSKRILQAYYIELEPDIILWAEATSSFEHIELSETLKEWKMNLQLVLYKSYMLHLASNLIQASKDAKGIRFGLFDASHQNMDSERTYPFNCFIQWCYKHGVRSFFAIEYLYFNKEAERENQIKHIHFWQKKSIPEENRIPTLQEFRNSADQPEELFFDMVHMTAKGSDLYARIVSDYLRQCWPCVTAVDVH